MVILAMALSSFAVSRGSDPANATDPRFEAVFRALPTTQGLITVVSFAQRFIELITITIVAANVSAEWSQGTLRNLLVREPGRIRLLAGKMLALVLFVALSATLAAFLRAAVTLPYATSHAVPSAPWTSTAGLAAFAGFWGGELLGLVGVSLLGMLIAVLTRSAASPLPGSAREPVSMRASR